MFHIPADLFRHLLCLTLPHINEKHKDLLSSEPYHVISFPHGVLDGLGNFPENSVSNIMAVLVVYLLEEVYINHQDAEERVPPLDLGRKLVAYLLKEPPVVEARELVNVRLLLEELHQALGLKDRRCFLQITLYVRDYHPYKHVHFGLINDLNDVTDLTADVHRDAVVLDTLGSTELIEGKTGTDAGKL